MSDELEALRPPFRVMIVDDHRFVAELLAQRLGVDSQIEVVGIANRVSAALHLAAGQAVDIALLDMELDAEDGLYLARELRNRHPEMRLVGLSVHDSDHYPIALLELGGIGFISKKASAREVVESVRRVAEGHLAISPAIAVYLATQCTPSNPIEVIRGLTAKEREILNLIAQGYRVRDIAQREALSEKTIQSHRSSLRRKLSARTDVDLCLFALKSGLVNVHSIPDT